MRRLPSHGLAATLGAVLTAGLFAGVGAATSSPDKQVFYACQDKSGAITRITASSKLTCTDGTRRVSWNAAGQVGPRGAAGGRGAPGPQGPPGPTYSSAQIATLDWSGSMTYGTSLSGGNYGFDGPSGVAFDGAHVWVANSGGNTVTEVDAATGQWIQTLSGGNYGFNVPMAVAYGGAHVWISNAGGNSVTELNAASGGWIQTLSGGAYGFAHPGAMAFDGSHMWVTNADGNSVTEFDAATGAWIQTLSGTSYGFDFPEGIAFDGSHLWVANEGRDSMIELNDAGGLVQTLSGGYGFNAPFGVVSDGADVWVTNYGGLTVTEFAARTGQLVRTISGVSGSFVGPTGIAFDGRHVWVTNSGCYSGLGGYCPNSVTELDAATGKVLRTLSGGNYAFNAPEAVAFDGSHIWVANIAGNAVTEITSYLGG